MIFPFVELPDHSGTVERMRIEAEANLKKFDLADGIHAPMTQAFP
jgi:hypothetical protein